MFVVQRLVRESLTWAIYFCEATYPYAQPLPNGKGVLIKILTYFFVVFLANNLGHAVSSERAGEASARLKDLKVLGLRQEGLKAGF